jgi:hypothetical protein
MSMIGRLITVVELEFNHGDVIYRQIMDNF